MEIKKNQESIKITLSAEEIIQLLKRELNLSLESKGKDYFAPCPFHREKSPSFAFEPEKKIFKCFGCGFSAGNVFKFWAEYKKISLLKAKQEISQLGYYVELEEINKNKEEREENEVFFLVSSIYQHNLFSIAGKELLDYLVKERNLTYASISQFGLGCAINYKQLVNLFAAQQAKENWMKELFSVGLIRINNNNQTYDFFLTKQLIFPLQDESGRTVSLASRKIGNWAENKYLYLPNYEGYQKSSFLYNYSTVKQINELDYCYLVEGFFDVISLNQAGIKNCLALLGTNISKEQLELLKKLKKKIILFLDGDLAGKQATIKITIALLAHNIDCEIINHPYNYDPDEICRFNPNELGEVCQKKEDPYLFIIQHFAQNWEIRENPQSVTHFIQKIAELFQGFPVRSQRFLVEKINQVTNWNKEEIEEIYFAKPKERQKEKESETKKDETSVNNLEKEVEKGEKYLLYYCAQSRYYWLMIQESNYSFINKENRNLYQYLYNFYTTDFYKNFDSKKLILSLNSNSQEGDKQNFSKEVEKIIISFTDPLELTPSEFTKSLEESQQKQNVYWKQKGSWNY